MSDADRLRTGYHNLQRREILDIIPTSARKILDLGCGTGELGKALKNRQPCHVTGIELSREAFETAQKNLDRAVRDNLNRFDPALDNTKYDCLIFGDILEHLISPWAIMIQWAKMLTENGVVIASIPNIAHPSIIEQLQRGIFRYQLAGICDITHLRFFTKTTICQLFYRAGLKVTDIKPHPAVENPIQWIVTAIKPPEAKYKPIATIIILTYNAWRFTKKCLESIKEHTKAPYKILVIDNGSTDNTVQHLRDDRDIFHIENTHNQGFARGFNIGIELVDTPFFVICNNDTVVTPNWLKTMIEHMLPDKDLMLLGPRSNYVSGPQEIPNLTYINNEEMLKYATARNWPNVAPLTYHFRIVFFFVLVRAAAIQRVGYLDENFIKSNFEDDDYCLRVAKAGLKAAYDNTVFIHHWGRATFKENKSDWEGEMQTNKAIFLKKHGLKAYGPGTPIPGVTGRK